MRPHRVTPRAAGEGEQPSTDGGGRGRRPRDAARFADHLRSIYVREDALADAVHAFFTDRILGQRHDHLQAELRLAQAEHTATDPGQVQRPVHPAGA